MGRQHVNTDGLLHRTRRAVIFHVLKSKGKSTLEYARVLGISDHTLNEFLRREGFQFPEEVDGPYPADLEALRELVDIQSAEDNSRRVGELEEQLETVTRLYENLLKAQEEYARQLGYLASIRHRNKLLQRTIKNMKRQKCKTCHQPEKTIDPTPEEIAEECARIREKAEKHYSGTEVYCPKVYKIRFQQ